MNEHDHYFFGKLLLFIGTITGAAGIGLNDIDIILAICLKLTGIFSFLFYILLNHDKISQKWYDLKKRFKK